jgi:prepilin-type N-terminal cleavage/methylation domain-containing protein
MKRKAFTLAEVLIVLGIVGVVSALTIPSLVHNYKKRLIETRLVKIVKTINEMFRYIENDEGNIEYWNYVSSSDNNYVKSINFAQKTVMKYLKNASVCTNDKTRQCMMTVTRADNTTQKPFPYYYKVVLPDGTAFAIILDGGIPSYPAVNGYGTVYIDLGISKNTMYNGVDFFVYKLIKGPKDGRAMLASNNNASNRINVWSPYLPKCGDSLAGSTGVKTSLLERCADPTLDDWQGYLQTYCAAVIECNNWKIPDDYMIKF